MWRCNLVLLTWFSEISEESRIVTRGYIGMVHVLGMDRSRLLIKNFSSCGTKSSFLNCRLA